MKPHQVNNAFGDGSPNWNLPFPPGKLTAAEIIAYCPHWLKSIDVIDRFVTNGGKSLTIATMINEFRHQPRSGTNFVPNSVCAMMQYAMRRAGFDNWTVKSHTNWARNGEWNEKLLDVRDFRTPRITHPRSRSAKLNMEEKPIEFRDLAMHTKKHPSGFDALDLTRCVRYALNHPGESWLFPADFEELVNRLGGPGDVTVSHLDREIFSRHSLDPLPPLQYTSSLANSTTFRSNPHLEPKMARTRSSKKIEEDESIASQKDNKAVEHVGSVRASSKRRSGRLAKKDILSLREVSDPDATDTEVGTNDWVTPKKRKASEDFEDGEFTHSSQSTSSTDIEAGDIADDFSSPTPTRRAAKIARTVIQTIATRLDRKSSTPLSFSTMLKHTRPATPIDPEIMAMAGTFDTHPRQTTYLKPPFLPPNRLRIDSLTILLYAEDGAKDPWASALSSKRFNNGPRRHAPFRELHRLSNPDPKDESDWAENIRWAKEQHDLFGSTTWTEYDYHLEMIEEHRRANMWISEDVIKAGM